MKKNFHKLELNGICIREFELQHLTSKYVSWLNDPEVIRFSEQRYFHHTFESCKAYYEKIHASSNYFLAVESTSTALGHVGNIGINIDVFNKVADMTILIGDKKVWGTGFASLAWSAVLKEVFRSHGIRKITAGTMDVNKPMLKLMQRSGMNIEAVHPRQFLWCGKEVGLVKAAIFAANSV